MAARALPLSGDWPHAGVGSRRTLIERRQRPGLISPSAAKAPPEGMPSLQRPSRVALSRFGSCDGALPVQAGDFGIRALAGEDGGAKLGIGGAHLVEFAAQIGNLQLVG